MTKKAKGEFIFQEDRDGKLQFVGDFDGLYASDIDPWEQSANGDLNYKKYYDFSRARLARVIKSIENKKMHGLLLSTILNDSGTNWHSETGKRYSSMRWHEKNPAAV